MRIRLTVNTSTLIAPASPRRLNDPDANAPTKK